MAFNPSSIPIVSVLCYKDKVLVSFENDFYLQLYSLAGYPYPFITSVKLSGCSKCLEWGVRKDVILSCTDNAVYALKYENK
jgi:hypothetical protein